LPKAVNGGNDDSRSGVLVVKREQGLAEGRAGEGVGGEGVDVVDELDRKVEETERGAFRLRKMRR
jgi:hypothetical protein